MNTYHKIQSLYKRDPKTNYKTLLEGEYSLPEFEYLKDNIWEYSEKVDGTNVRTMFDGEAIKFGGKTDKAQMQVSLLNALNDMFLPKIDTFKEMFPGLAEEDVNVCLYGEGYGPKINKGGKYRKDHSFVLFDVKIGSWWLKRDDIEGIAKNLGIDVVPIIGKGTLEVLSEMVRKGLLSQWGDFVAEGIVARPKIELKARNGERIITKLKHKDF